MIERENYQNKISATCKQFAEVTSETINAANRYKKRIETRVVGYVEDEENHVEIVATIDGKNYCLSIDKDLYKIQKGMKTVGFATSNIALDNTECEIVPFDEIKKMEEKLNYCKYGMYMDDAIEMIKKEMQDPKNMEELIPEHELRSRRKEDIVYRYKVDFIFKYLKNNLQEDKKLKIYELCKYYNKLFKILLTEKEKEDNTIQEFDIYLKDDIECKRESALYQIQMKDKVLYYLYDDDEGGFIDIDGRDLRDLDKKRCIEYLDYLKPEYKKVPEDNLEI